MMGAASHVMQDPVEQASPIAGADWAFGVARGRDGRLTIIAPKKELPGIVDLQFGQIRIMGLFVPEPTAAALDGLEGDAERVAIALRRSSHDCAGLVIDLNSGVLVAVRSASSVAPLSVHERQGCVAISNLDRLAALLSGRAELNVTGALGYLLNFFPSEPDTLYDGVVRLPRGQVTSFRQSGPVILQEKGDISEIDERPASRADLFSSYRSAIVQAMGRRMIGRPALMLSGGIDSVALGVYLSRDMGYSDAPAFTFTVRGAKQDEAPIAAEAARALGLEHHVIEIDPHRAYDLDSHVVARNAPDLAGVYFDYMAQAALSRASNVTTFFAGQDTRLHTPWLTAQELLALEHPALVDVLVRAASIAARFSPDSFAQSASHKKRLAYLLGLSSSLKRLFVLRLSKSNYMPILFRREAVETFIASYAPFVEGLLADRGSLRKRFNAIVERTLFRAQVPFDSCVLREPMLQNGFSLALPYYDEDLARVCAQLPWSEVAGTMDGVSGYDLGKRQPVNKVFLRRSLEQDLPSRLLLRAKAVMPTSDVAVNGMIGDHVRRMAEERDGVLDSPLGRYLNAEGIRSVVRASRNGWAHEDRRIAYVVGYLAMLDCIVRAR